MQLCERKNMIDRGNSIDKGPEEGERAACSRNSREPNVTGTVIKEQSRRRWDQILQVALRIWE